MLEETSGFGALNQAKIRDLLEASFCKKLDPDYFGTPVERVIVGKDYQGIAIVRRVLGENYLDKFAVHPESMGSGIAKGIWQVLRQRYDSLIWRSRTDNPLNCWYARNSDSEVHEGKWAVFWYGMEAARGRELAPLVAAIPETFTR
jgi:acetylglutamate synthase